MKKLTDKDAILCVSIEEAIAIKKKIGSLLTKVEIKNLIEENGRIVMYQNKRWDYEKDVDESYKITKASKILNKGVSKKVIQKQLLSAQEEIKSLRKDVSELQKVLKDNTEVTVYKTPEIEGIKEDVSKTETTEIPKITEVQVDCSELTKEQIQELAEIVVDNGHKIRYNDSSLDVDDFNMYFKFDGFEHFFVGHLSVSKKLISIQEFRERFGKPKEIDWSKANFIKTDTGLIVLSNGKHEKHVFEGTIMVENDIYKYKKGKFIIDFGKRFFKLCTEPITLSN